ncbi:hypothetical protein ACMYSL_28635 [Klebsiella sp. MISC125]
MRKINQVIRDAVTIGTAGVAAHHKLMQAGNTEAERQLITLTRAQ